MPNYDAFLGDLIKQSPYQKQLAQNKQAEIEMLNKYFSPPETPQVLALDQPEMQQMLVAAPGGPAPSEAPTQMDVSPIMNIVNGGKSREQILFDQLTRAQSKALEQQRKGVGSLEEMVKGYQDKLRGREGQLDLTPILAGVDFLTDGNISQGYQAPENPTKTVIALEQALQKERGNLTDQEIDLIKTQLGYELKKGTGLKPLSQTMIKTINEGNVIPGLLQNVESTIVKNQDAFGPIGGRLAAANPYDTRAQTIDAEMRATSQAFGKYMEGGVLRKEDEAKYRKMFPQLSDTPEVAKNKLRVVQDLLRNKQQKDIEAFTAQGYDLTGLSLPEMVSGGMEDTKVYQGKTYRKIGNEWVEQ